MLVVLLLLVVLLHLPLAALLLVVYFLPEGVLGLVRHSWRRALLWRRGGVGPELMTAEADAAAEVSFVGFGSEDPSAL